MKLKYILFSLVGVLVVAFVLLIVFGEKWAEHKINEQISKIEKLKYDTLDVDIAAKRVVFKGLTYSTDDNNLETKASQVEIKGIRIYQLIFTGKVSLKQIKVDDAIVVYRVREKKKKEQKSNSKEMPELQLDELIIENSHVQLKQGDKEKDFLSVDFDLVINEVDQATLKQPTNFLDKLTTFNSHNLRFITKDSIYRVGASSLRYAKTNNALQMDSIFVSCNYDKFKLGKIVGHETDWIKLNMDSARVESTDLKNLILNKHANKVTLHKPQLNVFLDKRLPFPEGKRPKLLKEMLAEKSASFSIDSILIDDADIVYEEYVKKAEGPGVVSFNKLSGHISNLYSANKKHQVPPRLIAKCDLLNTSKLYADVSFPLKPNDLTIVKGKLEAMDLTAFNTMMKYVAFTEIEQGRLNSLDFEFSYDQKTSNGKMNFAYEDLKIDFLNKDDAKTGGFFNEVKGFLANTFVVNSYNSYDSGKFRVGEISYERNMKKSMFNFWWKSILTGFQSSTGVKSSEEKIDVN